MTEFKERRGDTETRRRGEKDKTSSPRPDSTELAEVRVPVSRRRSARPGFTLIEIMVVIAVIVLAMTLAIPAIKSLTGSRSVESSENVLSSYINFVRTEAIGLQRTEGVMFLLDTTTDRIKCAAVMQSGFQATTDLSDVTYLDAVPDRDPFSLPTGIRAWTMKDLPPFRPLLTPLIDPFPNARYLGFNPNANPNSPGGMAGYSIQVGSPLLGCVPGGVILFDKNGRLIVTRYGFRLANNSQLSQLFYPSIDQTKFPLAPLLQDWPNTMNHTNEYLASQIGLVLFDRETFLSQPDPNNPGGQFTEANDPNGGSLETAMEGWINQNTAAIFINRYDGTLMRAE